MIKNKTMFLFLSLFSWALLSFNAQGKAPHKHKVESSSQIKMWTKKKGDYVDGNEPGKLNKKSKEMSTFKMQTITTYDVQYNKKKKYQGIYMSDLVKSYDLKNMNLDLVLFHFKNKMLIPIDLKNAQKNKTIFLALKVLKNKKWTSKFPIMEKLDTVYYYRDPNPTRFDNNKVVIFGKKNTFFYRNNKGKAVKRFTPWAHTNSLTGIEFVNARAYYRQFDISDSIGKNKSSDVSQGFKVFKDRCQYCHGVRMVGAGFGWDYVDPLKVSKMRDKKNLHLFVKYRKNDAFIRGLKMPNQIDLEVDETKLLWEWISAISKHKPHKYQP
jgi:hypothetical protein